MRIKIKGIKRFDELNFARFGVISINSRLDQKTTSWLLEYTINARTYRIEMISPLGRPHGVDSDTLVAFETLFVDSDCPLDNSVQTTASTIRILMGLPDNGESYHRIYQSIERLHATSMIVGKVSPIYTDPTGHQADWSSTSVRFFESSSYRNSEFVGMSNLYSGTSISVRLGEQLAENIRTGLVQSLDGYLLHQLKQPPARGLYRILQAHRRQDDGLLLQSLDVPLSDWRVATGLSTVRPEAIRRSLEAAHDELLTHHYLESASFVGRGLKAVVKYLFAKDHSPNLMLLRRSQLSNA